FLGKLLMILNHHGGKIGHPLITAALPAHATGTEAEIEAAFTAAYRILRRRIEAFLALPLVELARDRTRLKAELDRIGELSA
ncbi:ArsR family transcriptional regulator, partial [Alcaligenes faecalis subsp. faecalis NCIB 8687]